MRVRSAVLALAGLAGLPGCDLGIGSDPSAPYTPRCLPGHVAVGPSCLAPARDLAVDGAATEWDGHAIALEATCANAPCDGLVPRELWLGVRGDTSDLPATIAVRVRFDAAIAPSAELRLAWTLSPAPERPASGGVDRLRLDDAQLVYTKNDFVLAPEAGDPGHAFAITPDGFEAALAGRWLTHQGVSRVEVTVERRTGETWLPVAPSAPVVMCWGFDAYQPRACEVVP